MAFAVTKPPPAYLRHMQTSWLIISQDKAAFVMDCGGAGVVTAIQKLVKQGEIHSVEGLWVTHYHDDHTDGIAEFQRAFDCPCITDRHVADVITDPRAWRLPCLSPNRARVDRTPADGESWQWREFRLTSHFFPGQTLHHAGLLVEGRGDRMLFTGDSFTPAGIDDYCMLNRNWLGRGVGFDRCIALIEKLEPTHLFNCHVDQAWTFTAGQCRFMRENLAVREESLGRLVPWEHANHGMDESWVHCHPYEQDATAGRHVEFRVVVTNHSTREQPLACRAVPPRIWPGQGTTAGVTTPSADRATDWVRTRLPPKADGHVSISLVAPADMPAGRYVVPVDVRFGTWMLPQIAEAIVVL